MKKIIITLVVFQLYLSINAQTFDVDTIQYNGDLNTFINIVILGDGYLDSELSQFSIDADNTTNALFR